jgi:uncharacterized repeat protein (TIGR01451 family)
MSHCEFRRGLLARWFASLLVSTALALAGLSPSVARAQGEAHPNGGLTAVSIGDSSFTANVGSDNSFQYVNSNGFAYLAPYETFASSTGDGGWFVYTAADGSLHGPDFGNHPSGSNAFDYFVTDYVPFTGGSAPVVTGSGTRTDPITATTSGLVDAAGNLSFLSRSRFVNGDSYFVHELTVFNNSPSQQAISVFLASEIREKALFRDDASGAVGGDESGCSALQAAPDGAFLGVAHTPLVPADRYTASVATADPPPPYLVWKQLDLLRGLDNAVQTSPTCPDPGGLGLQWDRSIASGASATIQVATVLAGDFAIAPFALASVNPGAGEAGTEMPVTISGNGFLVGTTFDFGPDISVFNVSIVDSQTATADLVISPSAVPGPVDVVATQSANGVTSTATDGFLVTAAPIPLTLTSVSPASAEAGTSGLMVTINGTGFDSSLALDFGAGILVSNVTVEESDLAFATLDIDAAAVPGPRDVVATQGADSTSLPGGFAVDPVFVPLGLTSVSPASAEAGTSDLMVTINGTGFDSNLALDFGAGIVVSDLQVQDPGTALATLAIDIGAAVGPRDVVANQAGQSATLVAGFSVDPAFVPLSVTGIAPDNGDPGAGFDDPELEVTVTGAGFTSGLDLDFGAGITLSGILVQDSTTALTHLIIEPDAQPGPRDVVATQGAQTSTLVGGFTVNPPVLPPPLTIIGVEPDHGVAGTEVPVIIEASGLAVPPGRGSVVGVDFGAGIAVSDVSVDYASTPQHIFATLAIDPDATPGPRTITVVDGGASATLVDGFHVDSATPAPPFELTEVRPASGLQGTRVYVVLGGNGFQTDTAFDFGAGTVVEDLRILGGDRASAYVRISATAPVGPHAVTAVQSPGGTSASLDGAFTVVAPPPVGDGSLGTVVLALSAGTPGPLNAGDAFVYTLTLRNFSDAPVGQIEVRDELPGNLSVTALDCNGATITDGVLLWSVPGLAEGEGTDCAITVNIDSVVGDGRIVNVASVSYAGADGQVTEYTTTSLVSTVQPPQIESLTITGEPTTEDSVDPVLSADGSILVFSSLQKDLAAGNANTSGGADIYLRDRRTGETRVINTDVDGNVLVGESRTPDVSLNGQAIAFVFQPAAPARGAAKVGDGAASGQLCSSQPNSLFQMECDTTGVADEPLDGDVESPSLSADGKKLVFCSSASNWVADDTNGVKDVFLKDQTSGTVTRLSVDAAGLEADGESCDPVISADGNFVAFATSAPNLGGTAGAKQIVRKDLATGALLVVTGASDEPANADAGRPSISSDGSRIAFASRATNLVPEAADGRRNLFIFQAAQPGPASAAKGGGSSANSLFVMRGMNDELPDGDSSDPKIACSGSAIGFTSEAGNLVDEDSNDQDDYFVYGIESGSIVRPGPAATGVEPNGDANNGALDCEVTTGAYDSTATGPGNPNPNADVMSQADPLRAESGSIVLDGSFSGNWYDPGQSGHGFLLEALPDGDFYATWYTYDAGEPLFLQGRATPSGNQLTVSLFDARSTGFPVGAGGATTRTWGTLTLSFSSSNDAIASWEPVVEGFMPGSMSLHRLSRAALVESNRDQVTDACYSGIWYDRGNSGYGFDVEFNDMADGNRTVTAYWYTYQPDGKPLWLVGTGLADSDGTTMDLYRFDGAGAQFPPAFSASALTRKPWGTATLRFAEGELRVNYASSEPGYGSGMLQLQPLTELAGRTCD